MMTSGPIAVQETLQVKSTDRKQTDRKLRVLSQ